MGGGDPRVEGVRPGQYATASVGLVVEPEERPDQHVARLDGQEVPPARHVRRRVLHAGGEVGGAGPAGRVLGAQRRVTLDPLVDLGPAVQEVPGRVDADHRRAVDTVRVHPRVDHGETGPGALADQVDALVAEGDASGVDVVGLLLQRVAGEVYAGPLKPLPARGEGLGVRAQRRFGEEVLRSSPAPPSPRGSSAPKSRRRRGSRP